MPYNPADKFPGANAPVLIDIASVVDSLDASRDVPVVYTFGSGAPDAIILSGKDIVSKAVSGPLSASAAAALTGRCFVEFAPPYYPDP